MMKKIHSEGCDNILIVSRILISDVEICSVNILVIYHLQKINRCHTNSKLNQPLQGMAPTSLRTAL